MSVKEFEMYHGAVLTKVLRSEKPVALRLIETKPTERWSTYTLNDSIDLLITHCKCPRAISCNGGGTSWSFAFTQNQLSQMNPEKSLRPVWVAMVCGSKEPHKDDMHICLLNPEEILKVVDFSEQQQSVTVRKPQKRGQFVVLNNRKEAFHVPQSRIDKWEIPGS